MWSDGDPCWGSLLGISVLRSHMYTIVIRGSGVPRLGLTTSNPEFQGSGVPGLWGT
jgi:hypothetical protein